MMDAYTRRWLKRNQVHEDDIPDLLRKFGMPPTCRQRRAQWFVTVGIYLEETRSHAPQDHHPDP